ncbi:hypothetical protein ACHWQZ_G009258 [Mnemiopsis leidyi]
MRNLSLKLLVLLLALLTVLYVTLISSEHWDKVDMTDLNSDPELETQTRKFEKKPAPISPVWEEINAIKVPRSPEHVSSHVTDGKKKLFVLIVAGFRTGSTLLGQFFNQNDKIFYIFEPLHQNILWGHRPEIPGSTSSTPLPDLQLLYLHHLLDSCSIFSYTEFRRQMSKVSCGTEEENQARYGSRECGELPPNFMSGLCREHDIIVLKTIRIRDLRVLQNVLKVGGHDVKVIHLLRDPRGVINSRKRFSHFYLRDLEEVPVLPPH